jgi:predicted ATPase/DNA-binding SARP family transcriptional activator
MNQPKLQLSLLGGLTITQNGTAVSNFASRKVEALLAYLVCNPRPHSREVLATLLWPNNDQTRALANLSVALTSLRKQLEPYILTERHTISFNGEADFWLDTAVFQEAISQARESQKRRGKLGRVSAAQLATAVSLYKGDFLAGFTIRGAPEFEAWALLEQERLRQMLLTALADLSVFYQQRGQLDDGIRYAQQLLAVDPLQEETQRQLMALYAQNNQRSAALGQYQQCVRILEEELGVEPDEETTALYKQIAEERGSRGAEEVFSPLHNFPTAATSFIGREDELTQIEQWLKEPNGRLLTIIGQGGMGKTRLAQEAAHAHLGEFTDGVWYVSLVPYTDMGGVVTAVAAAIGLTFSGNDEPTRQLLTYLKSREMLLLLDNLEHLLTPDLLTFITQLTEQAPDLRLIATSRERLRLQAETLLELHGLPTPQLGKSAADYAAAQLFVDRVQRIQANFKMDEQETAVIQLCQLVGGLPLALELAATWTRILSVTEIVAEIERGLDALTSSLHDLPARHRSIRAVIESSWQMLPADEQRLFSKLSIFRGGFTREAAQQVANATLSQLMSLVDRSFLRLDADQRFRRHPLLLQFASQKLAENPDEMVAIRARHGRFFADQLREMERPFFNGQQLTVVPLVIAELENVRQAWQWAADQPDLEALDGMCKTLYGCFIVRQSIIEGESLFGLAVKMVRSLGETAVLGKLLARQGAFAYRVGFLDKAKTLLTEALHIAETYHHEEEIAFALARLADTHRLANELDAAESYAQRSLTLSRQLNSPQTLAGALITLGAIYHGTLEFEKSRPLNEESLTIYRSINDNYGIYTASNNLGIDFQQLGQPDVANEYYLYAIEAARTLGDLDSEAVSYFNMGDNSGDIKTGIAYIQKSLALLQQGGQSHTIAYVTVQLGEHYLRQGSRLEAWQCAQQGLQKAVDFVLKPVIAYGLFLAAKLLYEDGEGETAVSIIHLLHNHPTSKAYLKKQIGSWLAEHPAASPPPKRDTDEAKTPEAWANVVLTHTAASHSP